MRLLAGRPPRGGLSRREKRVVRLLALMPGRKWGVPDIADITGVRVGSIYVVLAWLEQRELVRSGWGERVDGGPRRRWYLMTAAGVDWVHEEVL